MKNKKVVYWTLCFLFVVSLILASIVLFLKNDGATKVAFLDVGQGDSILVSQGRTQMLVDGGENGKVILEKLGRYVPFWDRNIEVLVLTHPDADHLGGLLKVLQSYNVKTIIFTKYENDSKIQLAWKKLVESEGANVVEAVQGMRIKISDDLSAEVLYPFYSVDVSDKKKSNNFGIAMKIFSNRKSFLLMGDLSKEEENEMIESEIDLNADVLKVGHHGSKNSTGKNFLGAVSPSEVVISAGKDNSYGHPHQETLDSLKESGAGIFRTDESGDIIYECGSDKCELFESK